GEDAGDGDRRYSSTLDSRAGDREWGADGRDRYGPGDRSRLASALAGGQGHRAPAPADPMEEQSPRLAGQHGGGEVPAAQAEREQGTQSTGGTLVGPGGAAVGQRLAYPAVPSAHGWSIAGLIPR